MASFRLLILVVLSYVLCGVQDVGSECLNNYQLSKQGIYWKRSSATVGHFGIIQPNITGTMRNWQLQIEFMAPLTDDLKVRGVHGNQRTYGQTHVVLTPGHDNQNITNSNFHLRFTASFERSHRNAGLLCVQFCGTLDSGVETCPHVAPPPPLPLQPYGPGGNCSGQGYQTDKSTYGSTEGHFSVTVPHTIKWWTLTVKTDIPFTYFSSSRGWSRRVKGETNTYTIKSSWRNKFIEAGARTRYPSRQGGLAVSRGSSRLCLLPGGYGNPWSFVHQKWQVMKK